MDNGEPTGTAPFAILTYFFFDQVPRAKFQYSSVTLK